MIEPIRMLRILWPQYIYLGICYIPSTSFRRAILLEVRLIRHYGLLLEQQKQLSNAKMRFDAQIRSGKPGVWLQGARNPVSA